MKCGLYDIFRQPLLCRSGEVKRFDPPIPVSGPKNEKAAPEGGSNQSRLASRVISAGA